MLKNGVLTGTYRWIHPQTQLNDALIESHHPKKRDSQRAREIEQKHLKS